MRNLDLIRQENEQLRNQLAAAVWGMNVKIMQMDEWGNELSTPVYESSPVNTNKTRRKVIRITDRQ